MTDPAAEPRAVPLPVNVVTAWIVDSLGNNPRQVQLNANEISSVAPFDTAHVPGISRLRMTNGNVSFILDDDPPPDYGQGTPIPLPSGGIFSRWAGAVQAGEQIDSAGDRPQK